MVRIIQLVAAASLAVVASADHLVTFRNTCGRSITPVYHTGDGTTRTLATIGNGGSTSTVVPEGQAAWRAFGQTGTCSMPDGAGCLLLECSFDNPNFRQCNLSRVDGFNVGMTFSFSDGGCAGNNCLTNTCDGNHAFSTPTNGGPSLRQCNTPNVGMTVTFNC
ncbi:hypothetical protein C8R43DRAFT_1052160 [Mycena crocata]|nr:hypothetical protein C8R43DRAFT_1052160 [Mycena crocata]